MPNPNPNPTPTTTAPDTSKPETADSATTDLDTATRPDHTVTGATADPDTDTAVPPNYAAPSATTDATPLHSEGTPAATTPLPGPAAPSPDLMTTGAVPIASGTPGPVTEPAPDGVSDDDGALSLAEPASAEDGPARRSGAARDRVWDALLANPGATTTDLARLVEVSRTTVAVLLGGWADEGTVTGSTGPTARSARHWAATPSRPAHPDAHPAAAPPTDQPTAPAATDAPAPAPVSAEMALSTAPKPHQAGPAGRSTVGRLRPGALQGLVEDFLTENAGAHGPVAIGKAIGRSSGAVANALERLVSSGWAIRTDKPKRYQTADTPDTTNDATTKPDPADQAPETGPAPDDVTTDDNAAGDAAAADVAADDGPRGSTTAPHRSAKKRNRASQKSTPS